MKKHAKQFLQCQVGEGIFSGERIVEIGVEGKTISAIVDDHRVHDGLVEVEICDRKGGKVLVAIPGESFSTRKIWVSKDKLVKASK